MRISKLLLSTAAFVAPLIAPSVAYAESDDDLIVVTASRGERALSEVGQSITVIDAEDIERAQSAVVVDLLRTVPGVTFSRNGGVGTVTSVNIRGADATQTVTLIDGVKLNDPSTPAGGFNFGNLLTGNISRIEVVRGSQSVLWGSQAIGGVVNLITRPPTEDIAINARAEYGYRNSAQGVANVSGRFGPVEASVGAGYFRTDGFSAFSENRGATERDGYRNFGANGKLVVNLTDDVSVDLRGYYSDGETDIDGFVFANGVFGLADTPAISKTKEFVGYAGLNVALIDGRFQNRIAFGYTNIKRDDFNAAVQTFDGSGTNERLEYQGTFDVSDALTATFGAELETSRARTSGFGTVFNRSADLLSFYGQLSATPIEGLTATAGVRFDDHSSFGDATTFSANAVYSPNDGQTTIRVSYGEGFRVPALFQLFSNFGNTILQPERSQSYDVGVTQQLLDGKIELQAIWYQRDSDNLIDFIGCPTVPVRTPNICLNRPFGTYDNVSRARAQGVELGVVIRPVDTLTVSTQYSLIDAKNLTNGRVLARRPKQNINMMIDYEWNFGLKTGATITHVGDSFDDSFNSRRLDGYVVADLRASYPITSNIEVYGRIENLFDEQYETIFQYGTPGRAGYFGVRLRY